MLRVVTALYLADLAIPSALLVVGSAGATCSASACTCPRMRLVVGPCRAAPVDGVRHVGSPREAVSLVALHALGVAP